MLCVRNIPVDGEDTSEYMKDHIFELQGLNIEVGKISRFKAT